MKTFHIPKEVTNIGKSLAKSGFEAFLVGGSVRDILLHKKPKDYDIATNANPEEIQKVFEDSFYENEYGTVGVVSRETEDETLKVIEVTPYRSEGGYSDFRHPEHVTFEKELKKDLERRDFTINALAFDVSQETSLTEKDVIDHFTGLGDLKSGLIRAVGDANKRLSEDALRILRAIRFSAELGFSIDSETLAAIEKQSDLLKKISKERIREEFIKIVMSDNPMVALVMSQKLGLLECIAPELEEGIGIDQNQAHTFTVFEHLLRALQHAADKKLPLYVRLAALFHDIAKPATRQFSEKTKDWSFYGHEVVGARMTKKVLENLKFSRETIEKVVKLVRWHMFFSDTEQITLSAVRRLLRNVGTDLIADLMNLRMCDRIGTGRPKESPYRLRKYQSMIDEVMHDPISVNMLKINGTRLMEVTHILAGPKIGLILSALLEETLDDPLKNTPEYLEKKAIELSTIDEKKLTALGERGRKKQDEEEQKKLDEIRGKHHVQ